MGLKIKFSDIINHVCIGLIASVLFCLIFWGKVNINKNPEGTPIDNSILSLITIDNLSVQILALILFYITGLVIQSVINIIFGNSYNSMSITDYCWHIKNNVYKDEELYPYWMWCCKYPGRIVRELTEKVEYDLNSEHKSEWKIFNQFFIGTHFICLCALSALLIQKLDCKYALLVLLPLFVSFIVSRYKKLYRKNSARFIRNGLIFLFLCICFFFRNEFFPNENNRHLLLFLLLAIIVSFFCARYFAKLHIVTISALKAKDTNVINELLLNNNDIPTAFILIRTNSSKYIKETLQRICQQTYPKIKTLILFDKYFDGEDISKTNTKYTFIQGLIKEDKSLEKLDYLLYQSSETGPGPLSEEIRNLFLKNSIDDDIAIILDSDDYFIDDTSVERIVTRLNQTHSNVCVTAFEAFGNMNVNYAKDFHNILVRRMSDKIFPISDSMPYRVFCSKKHLDNRYLISTLGWVKSYKRSAAQMLQDMKVTQYSKFISDNNLTKYEDFPDIVLLLCRNTRICAVNKPTHRFRKEENSVTTKLALENYKDQIPGYLIATFLLYNLAWNQHGKKLFAKDYSDYILNRFILYKFIQYVLIVDKKSKNKEEILLIKEKGIYFCANDFNESMRKFFSKAEEYMKLSDVGVCKLSWDEDTCNSVINTILDNKIMGISEVQKATILEAIQS